MCAQVFGKFRTIDKRYNPTVVRSNIPGETLYADVIIIIRSQPSSVPRMDLRRTRNPTVRVQQAPASWPIVNFTIKVKIWVILGA
eukprot:COSAG01_NODE_2385_length_7787_cov_62.523023_3_plen_85_part_00